MGTTSEIRDVLAEIPAGTEVRLKLKDGSEVVGKLQGSVDDAIQLGDDEGVALDSIKTVLLDVRSKGPE